MTPEAVRTMSAAEEAAWVAAAQRSAEVRTTYRNSAPTMTAEEEAEWKRRLVAGDLFGSTGNFGGKSGEVRAALMERYACMALPHGAASAMAKEFGVSHELVRQIAVASGIRTAGTGPYSDRLLCAGGCGKEIARANKTGFCLECRWVELPCAACGAPCKRRASDIANRMRSNDRRAANGQARYTGRVYCNRVCFGKAHSKEFGWGSGRGRNVAATHPSFTAYQRGCRCDECREIARARWRNRNRSRRHGGAQ